MESPEERVDERPVLQGAHGPRSKKEDDEDDADVQRGLPKQHRLDVPVVARDVRRRVGFDPLVDAVEEGGRQGADAAPDEGEPESDEDDRERFIVVSLQDLG